MLCIYLVYCNLANLIYYFYEVILQILWDFLHRKNHMFEDTAFFQISMPFLCFLPDCTG